MNESSDNSDRSVMKKKRLDRHQIDVVRRAIKLLIARDGEAPLAKLGIHLRSLNEYGFSREDEWCGYLKLIRMIKAYPEFFEIYDNEANAKAVRIVANPSNAATTTTQPGLNMNFAEFVNKNFTDDFVNKICSEYGLNDDLKVPCVFRSITINTQHKASAEGKVLEADNMRLFHTGLFHNNTDDVYLLWGYDNNGNPTKCFLRRSGKEAREIIRLFGNKKPELVEFQLSQFNSELPIEIEFGHILDERADRIPEEIIDMIRHNQSLPSEYKTADKSALVRKYRNFLRRLLTGCIEDARKRLANRSDEPVEFWYKTNDKMCWLIPLRLGITEDVNLALVLEPSSLNDTPVYRAHTMLNLKEAFKCARLLGPVRAEWLCDAWKDNN